MRTHFFTLGIAAFLVAILAVPTAVFALANVNPGPSCTILSRNLSVGSEGSDVSNLQRFLVAQNYPGGGSWMVTGYYGLATQVAVRNLQLSSGLSQTGTVDAATRSAIQSASCGGQVLGTSTGFNTSGNYTYDPFTGTYYYSGGGQVLGTSVGTNNFSNYTYDPFTGTYVYTGGQVLGTSFGPTFNTFNPQNCSFFNCAGQSIFISHVSPTSAVPGTQVTITGSGFSEGNNTVHIGNGIVPFVRSALNGTSLSFEVPSTLIGFGTNQSFFPNQTYDLYVTNAFGQNSNRVSFSITGFGGNVGNRPSVTNISGPGTLGVNASGRWDVTVNGLPNTIADVSVVWGDAGSNANVSEQSIFLGQNGVATLSFSHSYNRNGIFSPTFIASNSNGANSRTTTVVVGTGFNSGQQLSLNSLSPSSGTKGSQIVLIGSGFTPTNNTIHFGIGGTRNVSSFANGTALNFTVPHFVSVCDTVVGSCNSTPTSVTTGSHQVFVTNSNGTTQTLNFVVTN